MAKKQNRVVKILMERDGLTESEAIEIVRDVKSEIDDCLEGCNCLEAEEIIMDELGLEPDYIFDILWCKL